MADPKDQELEGFSGVIGLFPLPGVVMFPHVVLPLHIFEPRYRQLLRDALETDQLIALVQSRPVQGQGLSESILEPFGCVGKILRSEQLDDGRFNLLLLGLRRMRIIRELPTRTLYRQAEVELIDEEDEEAAEPHREQLVRGFLALQDRHGGVDADFEFFLRSKSTMGALSDLIAHAMGLPPALNQALLSETRVVNRVGILLSLLEDLLQDPSEPAPPRPDTPPFSVN